MQKSIKSESEGKKENVYSVVYFKWISLMIKKIFLSTSIIKLLKPKL